MFFRYGFNSIRSGCFIPVTTSFYFAWKSKPITLTFDFFVQYYKHCDLTMFIDLLCRQSICQFNQFHPQRCRLAAEHFSNFLVVLMVQQDYVNKDTDLVSLHLQSVRNRCAEESERFFHRQEYDSRYCFEMLRRAIALHDQQAWEYVYQQYRPLVAGWVERHPLFNALDEDTEFFVNQVFEILWIRLKPEKFALSPGLSGVLSYLRKCVNSVLVDTMRSHERHELFGEKGDEHDEIQSSEEEQPEQTALKRDTAEKLWSMLVKRCKDNKERAVAHGSFVMSLKAAEIFEEYPEVFTSMQEVYRVKENLVTRLKRDQSFMEFLEN
jgi:DNA-directed RNA polymerase specialized sigma24 family protein